LKTEHYRKGRSGDGIFYRFFKLLAYPACMDEHRIASRHRVLKAGTIEFGGGAIDCTVRNLSGTGAALDVTSPVGIPDHFTLVLPAGALHQACHVVWRKEKRIGVTFKTSL
jgi:PilZ domain-containing protein